MPIRIPMPSAPAARAAVLAPCLVACLVLASCGGGGDDPGSRPVALGFDFSGGIAGWSGAAADYTAATAPIDVVWAHAALPSPLAGSGFRLRRERHLGGTRKDTDERRHQHQATDKSLHRRAHHTSHTSGSGRTLSDTDRPLHARERLSQ